MTSRDAYWIITTEDSNGNRNTAVEAMHPADYLLDWQINYVETNQYGPLTLIFALPISRTQYDAMKGKLG